MTQAHSQAHHASVLIIDRSQDWGADLSTRLAPLDLKVHVVGSREAALLLAKAKKIDVAVMEYGVNSGRSASSTTCAGSRCRPSMPARRRMCYGHQQR